MQSHWIYTITLSTFFFSLPTANTGKSPPFEVYPDLILLQFCLKLKLEPNPLMLVYYR